MNTYGYGPKKQQIAKRLVRIEGQVRGIAGMVDSDKYCIDILTQVSAVRAALDKVALELIRDHARHCLNNENIGPEDKNKKADELVAAISRML